MTRARHFLQFEDLPFVGAIRHLSRLIRLEQIALFLFRNILEEMTRVGDTDYGLMSTARGSSGSSWGRSVMDAREARLG
jgi:hypothetical protein